TTRPGATGAWTARCMINSCIGRPETKENLMRRLYPLCLSLTLLSAGGAALAQPASSAPSAAPEPQTIALAFDRIDIQRVAQTLTERTKKSVLLDGSVEPTLVVTATGSAKTLDEALDRLLKPLGLVWKKVYVAK